MRRLDHTALEEAARRITAWKRPLLMTHTKPDGDALGALTAMRAILRASGAEPVAILFEPIPSSYALFSLGDPFPVLGADVRMPHLDAVDGVVILDTCTYKQLRPIADWLRETQCPKLVVDHHVSRDDLADIPVIDETAAAACLILHEWADAVGWPLDQATREALFIGIATDTGWFRFANTDARVLGACTRLMEEGVRAPDLHQQLFQQDTAGRLRLLGCAISSLELLAGDRVAVMTLTRGDFDRSGAAEAETENIVNEPLRVASVAVSVILVEPANGPIRVSFRSKPPLAPDAPDVDVAQVAEALGGGGHRRAAATRIAAPLDEVRRTVIDHLLATLGNGTRNRE